MQKCCASTELMIIRPEMRGSYNVYDELVFVNLVVSLGGQSDRFKRLSVLAVKG